jgi:hypothetical protein
MTFDPDNPSTWGIFKPLFIAHDVGRTRDRSTAVVGGNSPLQRSIVGIAELEELPQGLYGSERASALAQIDRRYGNNALIVADLSNDATYGEILFEMFGPRLIGLQITRHGNGMDAERRRVKNGAILVYTIGRTYLLELFQSVLQSNQVRFADGPMSRKAYEQLTALETEYRESGTVYTCASGQHDDLGISCAMLAWAARHPHLEYWFGTVVAARRPRRPRQEYGWKAFV